MSVTTLLTKIPSGDLLKKDVDAWLKRMFGVNYKRMIQFSCNWMSLQAIRANIFLPDEGFGS